MPCAAARGAGLVELERDRPADALKGLLQGELHAGLDVAPAVRDDAAPSATTQIVCVAEPDLAEAAAPAARAVRTEALTAGQQLQLLARSQRVSGL